MWNRSQLAPSTQLPPSWLPVCKDGGINVVTDMECGRGFPLPPYPISSRGARAPPPAPEGTLTYFKTPQKHDFTVDDVPAPHLARNRLFWAWVKVSKNPRIEIQKKIPKCSVLR